jgi:hypothetical protein
LSTVVEWRLSDFKEIHESAKNQSSIFLSNPIPNYINSFSCCDVKNQKLFAAFFSHLPFTI